MTLGAHLHPDRGPGGAGMDALIAVARDGRVDVVGTNASLHGPPPVGRTGFHYSTPPRGSQGTAGSTAEHGRGAPARTTWTVPGLLWRTLQRGHKARLLRRRHQLLLPLLGGECPVLEGEPIA